jgi:putative chitobiose transport system substrate-binding protein
MKKILAIIAVIICICLLPFVWRNDSQTDKNEVVFWTLQMSDFTPYMQGIISSFEKQNPDIKIKWIDVPFSEGEKRTLAAILSNTPPDLVNLNPDFSAILAQKGALQKISENKTNQFNSEIIKSLEYNGQLYAIPWYATSAVTIYNKALFAKSGVKTLPKTYEDLGKISAQIKAKTGAYAFMPTITENDTMLKVLNKYGVNSPEFINSAESARIFNFYKSLYAQNLIPKESITQTQREALEKYMSGQLVFFQAGANFLNMIKENSPQTYAQTDVAPQITGSLGQNDFSLMNLVIPVRASHKAAALKFALYLTNAKNQLELGKLTNVLVTEKTAMKAPFYTQYNSNDLMAKSRVISASQLSKIRPELKQVNGQKEINLLINTAVQEVFVGQKPTKSILDDVAEKWKMLLKN